MPSTHGPPLTEEVLFKQTLALGNNFSKGTFSFGSGSLGSGHSSVLSVTRRSESPGHSSELSFTWRSEFPSSLHATPQPLESPKPTKTKKTKHNQPLESLEPSKRKTTQPSKSFRSPQDPRLATVTMPPIDCNSIFSPRQAKKHPHASPKSFKDE